MTVDEFFIPGEGWNTESVISGFIKVTDEKLSMKAIEKFSFDDTYPFTKYFLESPAFYGPSIIGFAGSYKQIEEDWSEWLWKFSELLTTLDAIEASVNLSCVLGDFAWVLAPESLRTERRQGQSTPYSNSTAGQRWGIVKASPKDFCINSEWIEHFAKNRNYTWDKFVPRWIEPQH